MSPKQLHTQAPAKNATISSTPWLPTKAAEDALELAVVSLPTSLQSLITHFGQK